MKKQIIWSCQQATSALYQRYLWHTASTLHLQAYQCRQTGIFFNKRTRSLRGNRNVTAIFCWGVLAKVLDGCMPTKGRDGLLSRSYLYIIEKDPPMTWTNTVTIPRTLRVWIQCQQGKHDNLSKKRDPQNPCPGRRLIPLYSPYTGVTPSPLGEGLWTEI